MSSLLPMLALIHLDELDSLNLLVHFVKIHFINNYIILYCASRLRRQRHWLMANNLKRHAHVLWKICVAEHLF